MADALLIKVAPLTLDTLCDGKVSHLVQAALAQVADAFADESLQEGRTGLQAKVVIEVGLDFSIDSNSVKTSGTVRTTLPQRRSVGGVAMLRGGKFLVEPEGVQEQMFGDNKRKRSGAE